MKKTKLPETKKSYVVLNSNKDGYGPAIGQNDSDGEDVSFLAFPYNVETYAETSQNSGCLIKTKPVFKRMCDVVPYRGEMPKFITSSVAESCMSYDFRRGQRKKPLMPEKRIE